jgi:hypothetical protein
VAQSVEIADSSATRRKGLLGRDHLGPDEGLWIVPCGAVHTLGMRFAIDLIYLDRKRRVKKVRSAVRPWRMSACLFAHSILELSPGAALRSRTLAGDLLEFSELHPERPISIPESRLSYTDESDSSGYLRPDSRLEEASGGCKRNMPK